MNIGILDSNLGGLCVVQGLLDQFPEDRFFYYADTLRAPYESKRPVTILEGVRQGIAHLSRVEPLAIVVICPVISATVLPQIRSATDLPVVDVLAASVRRALQISRRHRFALLGPRPVIDSGAYQRLIRAACPTAYVYAASAPLLPHLIDADWSAKPETRMIVKKYLHPVKIRQIDTLILACNHAVMLAKLIQAKAGRRIKLALPTDDLVDKLKAIRGVPTAGDRAETPANGDIDLFVTEIADYHRTQVIRYLKQSRPLNLLVSN